MSTAYFKHTLPISLLTYEPAIPRLAATLEEIDTQARERILRLPMLPSEFEQHRAWLGQHAPTIRGSIAQPFVTFATLLNEFAEVAADLSNDDASCLMATLACIATSQATYVREVADTTANFEAFCDLQQPLSAALYDLARAWDELSTLLNHPDGDTWPLLVATAKQGTWARLSDLARKHLILRLVA